MAAEVGAHRVAVTGDEVQHALGQTGGLELLGQLERDQRRVLVGLEHDGVARGQRRADLPDDDQQRDVPRHDRGHHAQRLAAQHTHGRDRPDLGPVLLELVGRREVGDVTQLGDGQAKVQGPGDADRRAVLPGLQGRQLLQPLLQAVRDRVQHRGTLLRRGTPPLPRLVRGLGGGNRPVHVGGPALGDRCHQLVRRGTANLVLLGGVDPFSVDEQPVMRYGHLVLLWTRMACDAGQPG